MNKIHGICLLVLSLASFGAAAQSDVTTVKWNIIGIQDSQLNLRSGVKAVESITLDTRWGVFGAANGVVSLVGNTAVPTVGSCFFGAGNMLFCELQVRSTTYQLSLEVDTGSGELSIIDESGFLLEEGAAIFEFAE